MTAAAWTALASVSVAIVTALVAPLVVSWLKGSQERESQALSEERAEMEAFRQEQREAYTRQRLELRTLQDAYRDLERKYDTLEERYREMERKLARQTDEVEHLRKENADLHAQITTLRDENYRLVIRLASLERDVDHA